MTPPEEAPEIRDHGPISLTLLLDAEIELDAGAIAGLLARYDEELEGAEVEASSEEPDGSPSFVARFAKHTVVIRVHDAPILEVVIEPSIQLGHYDAELKDRARAHRAAIEVEYVGVCDPPIIAHVVVAAVAGALASAGGASVLANRRAKTSVPVGLVAKSETDMISYLRALPPLLLFAGLAKYDVEGETGLWMRTHGNAALALPDFARHTTGHVEGQDTFALFSDMMLYMIGSRAEMAPGDVAQIGEDVFTLLRKPEPEESFLDDSDGPVLVVEVLDLEELTRRQA